MKVLYIVLALLFYLISVTIKGYVNYLIIDEKDKVDKKEAIKKYFALLYGGMKKDEGK